MECTSDALRRTLEPLQSLRTLMWRGPALILLAATLPFYHPMAQRVARNLSTRVPGLGRFSFDIKLYGPTRYFDGSIFCPIVCLVTGVVY